MLNIFTSQMFEEFVVFCYCLIVSFNITCRDGAEQRSHLGAQLILVEIHLQSAKAKMLFQWPSSFCKVLLHKIILTLAKATSPPLALHPLGHSLLEFLQEDRVVKDNLILAA